MVVPVNFELNFEAYLNKVKTKTMPVFNGAMTGIILDKGNFDVELILKPTLYDRTQFSHTAISLLLLFFLLYRARKKGSTKGAEG